MAECPLLDQPPLFCLDPCSHNPSAHKPSHTSRPNATGTKYPQPKYRVFQRHPPPCRFISSNMPTEPCRLPSERILALRGRIWRNWGDALFDRPVLRTRTWRTDDFYAYFPPKSAFTKRSRSNTWRSSSCSPTPMYFTGI